eukprot:c39118_g1_i1 orf=1-492(-)
MESRCFPDEPVWGGARPELIEERANKCLGSFDDLHTTSSCQVQSELHMRSPKTRILKELVNLHEGHPLEGNRDSHQPRGDQSRFATDLLQLSHQFRIDHSLGVAGLLQSQVCPDSEYRQDRSDVCRPRGAQRTPDWPPLAHPLWGMVLMQIRECEGGWILILLS